jgi:hypothetical protein
MIRETSAETYRNIKDDGLLSDLRFKVYDFVFKNGPCTISDVSFYFNISRNASGSYSSRFSELREMGILKEVGTIKCKITGRNKILWDVTSKLPEKLKKEKRKKCVNCNGKGYIKS